jgi:plasmid replication initiation protein
MPRSPRRRQPDRPVALDRSLEGLPVFRLSDSADEGSLTYSPRAGGRWRVLPAPGDRIPGTFDQDVWIELLRRQAEPGHEEGQPITFTLHAFLRSMGRQVDGRTYELLRAALTRLSRTTLESHGAWYSAESGGCVDARFSLLASLSIERRRESERHQLALFDALTVAEPGEARVTIAPLVRRNIASGHVVTISSAAYAALASPVSRRLYRLLELARVTSGPTWELPLEALAEQIPLVQRFPSHLQRVLGPAHEALHVAGLLSSVVMGREAGEWTVRYELAPAALAAASGG